jgi:predicted transcriptional regulator
MENQIDEIFSVLGNRTRRDILFALSDEPMYFNQISKEIGIGQQAMWRHMQALEDIGFVSTYGEKSDLGAPDRKYYSLDSTFNLTISLSKDEFAIDYNPRKTSDDKLKGLFSRRWGKISNDPNLALGSLRNHLEEIDREIEILQTEIDNLREIRQVLLQKVHEIVKINFSHIERKILYKIMRQTPSSVTQLSQMINEDKSEVRNGLGSLQSKMDKGKIRTLVEGLIA